VKTKDTTIDASTAIAFEERKARMISKNDRFLPTSPQPGNEKEIVNIHVSPNDQSLDSQVQSPFLASKPPPVNDPEEKLHSSPASNTSGHPNDGGKKADSGADSSSSDESSSSDDSEDGTGSASTRSRGKNLAIK
jgi:hypothetical protein